MHDVLALIVCVCECVSRMNPLSAKIQTEVCTEYTDSHFLRISRKRNSHPTHLDVYVTHRPVTHAHMCRWTALLICMLTRMLLT